MIIQLLRGAGVFERMRCRSVDEIPLPEPAQGELFVDLSIAGEYVILAVAKGELHDFASDVDGVFALCGTPYCLRRCRGKTVKTGR